MSNRPWWVLATGCLLLPLGYALSPRCPYCRKKTMRLDVHVATDCPNRPY